MLALERYAWPGNVRELQNCLAARRGAGRPGGADGGRSPARRWPRPAAGSPSPDGDAAVLDSLRRHGFDMQATAGALGWDRSTVTQRLKGWASARWSRPAAIGGKAALALAGDPALAAHGRGSSWRVSRAPAPFRRGF